MLWFTQTVYTHLLVHYSDSYMMMRLIPECSGAWKIPGTSLKKLYQHQTLFLSEVIILQIWSYMSQSSCKHWIRLLAYYSELDVIIYNTLVVIQPTAGLHQVWGRTEMPHLIWVLRGSMSMLRTCQNMHG